MSQASFAVAAAIKRVEVLWAVCEEEFAFGPSCPQHSSHLNRIIAVVFAPGSVLMI